MKKITISINELAVIETHRKHTNPFYKNFKKN